MTTTLIPNKRSPVATAWLKREVAEQNARYRQISKRMNEELAPKRAQRYTEFLERIQTRGYSVHYDQLRKIEPHELPKKPRGKDRVVW